MRAKAGFLILLGLFILMGTVSAYMADSASTIVAGREWVVANNSDVSVITVVAKNLSSGQSVKDAQVVFTIDDPVYGMMTALTVTSDANGIATSSFKTKTKSGTAVITATITSIDGSIPYTTTKTIDQKIDHDLPQNAVFDNPAQLPVGTVSTLTITLKDRWGNLIDNKNPAEHHTFYLYMLGGQGRGFWDGSNYISIKQVETGAYGNASTQYRIANVAGPNWIYMDTIGNMVSPPETWIEGISLDTPCYIYQEVPSPNDLRADGIDVFGLYYYVYDKYMNPVNNTQVQITASDGSSFSEFSNTYGSVFVTFGPKDTSGTYTINATAVDNASAVNGALCINTGATGTCSQDLTFHNTEPVDIIVSGNPLSMTSTDVDPTSHGIVQVKVVDIKGNAVVGENVQFSMGTPAYDYPYTGYTNPPPLSPTSATTGIGGYATTTFTPGAFATGGMGYNDTSTGSVKVTATWTNAAKTITKSQDVTFVWKNYPYLSVTVPQEACKDVKVGDKINVSVSIFGDGAALKPKPIDVVLATDVSGSMSGQKITDAKAAGKIFAASMSTRDRVGLESYGWATPHTCINWTSIYQCRRSWPNGNLCQQGTFGCTCKVVSPYCDKYADDVYIAYAKNDLPLTFVTFGPTGSIVNLINTTITNYGNGGGSNTPMRAAIYNATHMIKSDPRGGTVVQAIVLMTDGLWNTAGDPEGISTSYPRMAWASPDDPVAATQSVIDYAKTNNIRIYTVGLGSDVNGAELLSYATQTGGKYYPAPTSSQLASIYKQIAGDLQETAGGSTTVNLNFNPVTINGNPSGDIGQYMEYVADVHSPSLTTDSTYLNKTNLTPSGTMYFYNGYPISQDDSSAWATNAMTYNVGDIKLNDTWSVTFRLNLTQMGQVELFGPNSTSSKICFTDASTTKTTCQGIQALKCNIQQQKINIPFGDKSLFVDNLSVSSGGPDPNILTIKWNTTYDGEKVVLETVSYHNLDIKDSHYDTVPGGILYEPKCYEKTSILTIDTTSWPAGDYSIRVFGQAVDAKSPGAVEVPWTKQGPNVPKYIKLE